MLSDLVRTTRWRLVAAGVIALLALTEVAVRRAGLVDFPVYERSQTFGYAPRSAQAGAFLGRNHWVFNDRGLGVERPWRPDERPNILLIGNSIVLGGNLYDQKDKLAPQLQSHLGNGCTVWPAAAGGWTTINEMRFLQNNPDLIAATDFFVWEYMPGQMERVNPWTRDVTHPTERPVWATGYLLRKAIQERFGSPPPVAPPTVDQVAKHYVEFDGLVARLAAASQRSPPGIIFLYPDRNQLANARRGVEWVPDRARVESLAAAHQIKLVDIARFPQWTDALYKDGVHPTAEGNAVLAAILGNAVQLSFARTGCGEQPLDRSQ